jgi:hypothetical protein
VHWCSFRFHEWHKQAEDYRSAEKDVRRVRQTVFDHRKRSDEDVGERNLCETHVGIWSYFRMLTVYHTLHYITDLTICITEHTP